MFQSDTLPSFSPTEDNKVRRQRRGEERRDEPKDTEIVVVKGSGHEILSE